MLVKVVLIDIGNVFKVCWFNIRMVGLLVVFSVCFYVVEVLLLLVGWIICMFGMYCKLVNCLIGLWVGLFLLIVIELCVKM